MLRTPWGNAEDLRERKLAPHSGLGQAEVAQSQRERLFGAMVGSCEERGYEATTVADLVTLSGVSRADFYKHFADKRACFVATLEAILERAMEMVALRYDGRGSALRSLAKLMVEQPAAARLCFVEAYAAGPEATAAMDRAVAGFEGLVDRAFEQRSGGTKMPAELVGAIVGGLRTVFYARLRSGREAELESLTGELWKWSFSYEPPAAQLVRRGGRAVAPASRWRLEDPAERIIAACVEEVAERGYAATTIDGIVSRASVSLTTFYEHFDGKADAMAAALDAGEAQLLAATLPAYRRAKEWSAAIRGTVEAMFAFLAAEPYFARLAMVEIFAAGQAALERRERTLQELRGYLEPGYKRSPKAPAIAAEAISGAIYSLTYNQICERGAERLPQVAPLASYLALAPFLGGAEACVVANGSG